MINFFKGSFKSIFELLKFSIIAWSIFYCNESKSQTQQPYNVLLITIDDLNDWVGYLGGNSQSLTPNIDKLAAQSLIFNNAQCASTLCNPSRVAFLTGFMPATSKLYSNNDGFRSNPVTQNAITLPEYFKQNGYYTMSVGKVFHDTTGYLSDPQSWDVIGLPGGNWDSVSALPGFTPNGLPINLVDDSFWWAPQPDSVFVQSSDYKKAEWVKAQLNSNQPKPFFIGCGFSSPHLEWNVPEMFLNKFPLNAIVLPAIDTNDLDDIGGGIQPSEEYYATKNYALEKESVRSYLGAITYVDSCVGIVLNELEKSAYASNTIVVLLSDNGFHLGEKLRYKKFTLWEESARIPLLIKLPSFAYKGTKIHSAVNLIDLYPTLTDLCNLKPNTNNEGISLLPFFDNPKLKSNRASLTTIRIGKDKMLGGSTIRTRGWRYTLHYNNEQELYNHLIDSNEFVNLATNVLYDSIRNSLALELDKQLNKNSTLRLPIRTNTIPGEFQAEKYDMGGEGISYHDIDGNNKGKYYRPKDGVDIFPCADVGGGLLVDSIVDGEWLTYTIASMDSGTYMVKFRVLSNSSDTNKIKVYVDSTLVAKKAIGNTANVWKTISTAPFVLPQKSKSKIRIVFNGAGFALNSFEFVKVNSPLKNSDLQILNSLPFEIHPNPVNNVAQLKYTLPKSGTTSIYLTNLLGEKVCTILNEQMEIGTHSYNFYPERYNLPAGFYQCTLEINNHHYSISKKLIIAK